MNEKKFLDCVMLVGNSASPYEGTKTYVSTGAVDCNHINYGMTEKVTYQNRPSRANLMVESGDVLFAKMNGTKKTLRIDSHNEANLYSTGFYAVRANNAIITPQLLYHLLSSEPFLNRKDQNCSGAAQKAITNDGLKKIIIKIPNMEIQQSLADELDRIDDIISLRKQQLEKLDNLIRSRFVELFGDPITNLYNWEKFPLGKRCKIITGNTPSRADTKNYGAFVEWIKSDNINTPYMLLTKAQEYLSESGFQKCRHVDKGSLLMTCIAGTLNCIGNVAITDRHVAFNQQINAITPEQDEVLYLYWLMMLSKPLIHSAINMSLKGILSKSQLAKMEFPFPPLALQKNFSVFVEQTNKMGSVINQSLIQLETVKEVLTQQHFGGMLPQ